VFILDEMITGFRWHLKGAQHKYGVTPDISTFGKAMANGFSVACVAGRREVMQLGSIERPGAERVFLLSTTHGAEMSGLGAFLASSRFIEREGVVEHLWTYGAQLMAMLQDRAAAHGLSEHFKVFGAPCSPHYLTLDAEGKASLPFRTLFLQEMVKGRVLIPWVALSFRHGSAELALTTQAADAALRVYRRALDEGIEKYLVGEPIRPVFRRFN
jgi:glutamate-1-semialdehyde 2,1-aminomutase